MHAAFGGGEGGRTTAAAVTGRSVLVNPDVRLLHGWGRALGVRRGQQFDERPDGFNAEWRFRPISDIHGLESVTLKPPFSNCIRQGADITGHRAR
ncbi:hypothetical protein Mpe_A0757 [Methylibium petroleiphilum PM1]|uniref:Uncharacterized protein n=1 Tax=Methylibium petroleiphilum (strain ATCC BAA-1232 / LMG 22953 / PM1) TaxID=420662 RepID=A2SDT0_METPP|nr:hypothetical protein Mpe_A0757 [Methylibium petroleiphilum PM1]